MKKIYEICGFLFLALIVSLAIACDTPAKPPVEETIQKSMTTDTLYVNGQYNHYYDLVELTFHGETHQYVYYKYTSAYAASASIAHWPDCEYCKQKQNK